MSDPKALSAEDLVGNFKNMVSQIAGMKAKAANPAASSRYKQAQWAGVKDVESRLNAIEGELYRRLGVDIPASLSNRPAFIQLALAKQNRVCEKCGSAGGIKGRFLNWFTNDGMPWPLIAATNGATKEQVREKMKLCKVLCVKCAKPIGAKFDKRGRPDLREYR